VHKLHSWKNLINVAAIDFNTSGKHSLTDRAVCSLTAAMLKFNIFLWLLPTAIIRRYYRTPVPYPTLTLLKCDLYSFKRHTDISSVLHHSSFSCFINVNSVSFLSSFLWHNITQQRNIDKHLHSCEVQSSSK